MLVSDGYIAITFSGDWLYSTSQEKQLRREAEISRHKKRREELAAQTREEQELLQSATAERHKQAVERYHNQCGLKKSQIKQVG